ncbi:hydroxymethylbilane synthase [Leptospira sp. GIMC2001]|uniref:hydroxymethylbilane synthase n=1 Tax=Leptospira sp. GIMC2001 TaxID=1513297 RepID=UPI00234AAB0E|nr:hydroxymethylbilane synthase [Leptospira sp. GIMC2001]WCL49386.1 hydroxymethylbilane synthase [Leptospira sp. GIMC2001]
MSNTIIIGARKSALAKIQAYRVGQSILELNPNLIIEYCFQEAAGDKDLTSPLWKMEGKGVFTRDLQVELIENRIDCVVHSWKDLDLEERSETETLSILPREDQRDVLLIKSKLWETAKSVSPNKLNEILKICTSSPRREYNLGKFLPSLLPIQFSNCKFSFTPIRGNIQTRIKKFLDGDYAGLVIAKAALDRLIGFNSLNPDLISEDDWNDFSHTKQFIQQGISLCQFMILPLSLNPNAPAQGGLVLELRKSDHRIKDLFMNLQDAKADSSSHLERKILKKYGGGCHQKIGVAVLERDYGQIVYTRGLTDQGIELHSEEIIRTNSIEKFHLNETWHPSINQFIKSRERIPCAIASNADLWITKSFALPKKLPAPKLIWTAGTKTWKELARRGYWVNGTSDGLGESDSVDLENLTGRVINFVKLTHDQSQELQKESKFRIVSTYRISNMTLPQAFNPDRLKAAYWSSSSEYKKLTDLYPQMKKLIHFCGPGSTYRFIRNDLIKELDAKIYITLSYEHWKREFIISTETNHEI